MTSPKVLLSLLRELDLRAVQAEAERPVRLALVGGPDPASNFAPDPSPQLAAELVTALGGAPWVSVLTDASERRAGDLLLRVSRNAAELPYLPDLALELLVGPAPGAAEGSAKPQDPPGRLRLADLGRERLERELAPALLERASAEQRLALARHLPLLRPAYAARLIEETSRANATYAASTGVAEIIPVLNLPLNLADLVVLTKNQLMMGYKLALAYGKSGKPTELMREIVSVVGGGLLFRQVARSLVGLVPVWGIVPKVAVAYAGTWVIGRAVQMWASGGERAALSDLRGSYAEALARGRTLAEGLVQRLRREERAAKDGSSPSEASSSTKMLANETSSNEISADASLADEGVGGSGQDGGADHDASS